jgi:protein-tyrosine-phosphatase
MAVKLRVVFYCIGNSCRSPMAEAICRFLGAGEVEAQSAGVAPLGRISDGVYNALAALSVPSGGLYSKPLSAVRINKETLVISLARGFPVKRVLGPELGFEHEDWDIPDPYDESAARYLEVAQELMRRIEALLRERGITAE